MTKYNITSTNPVYDVVDSGRICIFCGSNTLYESGACEACITEKVGNGHQPALADEAVSIGA